MFRHSRKATAHRGQERVTKSKYEPHALWEGRLGPKKEKYAGNPCHGQAEPEKYGALVERSQMCPAEDGGWGHVHRLGRQRLSLLVPGLAGSIQGSRVLSATFP